ncbi:MAG: DUF1844 domain-containing protein [Candidatus Eisenbacteria bacterium]|mgnify:CR=1 FL=1
MSETPGTPTNPPDATGPGPGAAPAPATMSNRDLFLGLVHSFQAAAMQQMGKTANPFTQEIERDLPQAQLSIDMLRMLEERTKGNLTSEESRFLAHVLRELQLNYVMEMDEEKKRRPAAGGAAGEESGAGA